MISNLPGRGITFVSVLIFLCLLSPAASAGETSLRNGTADHSGADAAGALESGSDTGPADSAEGAPDYSGHWEMRKFVIRIEADITYEAPRMVARVTVHDVFEKNVYHFRGDVLPDGRFRAVHSSGHVFEGRYIGTDRIKGRVTLKDDRTYDVDIEKK